MVRTPLPPVRKNHPSMVRALVRCSDALSGALTYAVVPLRLKAWPTSPVVYVALPFAVAKLGPIESTPLFCARYHATAPLGMAVHDVGVTVVVLLALLLAPFGSGSVPLALADSVSVPGIVGVTTIAGKKFTEAPIELQLHVTVPTDGVHVPLFVGVEETYVEFDGSVTVRTGFVPCDVLLLNSWIVKVTFPPAKVIGSGVPLMPTTRRSI